AQDRSSPRGPLCRYPPCCSEQKVRWAAAALSQVQQRAGQPPRLVVLTLHRLIGVVAEERQQVGVHVASVNLDHTHDAASIQLDGPDPPGTSKLPVLVDTGHCSTPLCGSSL